MALREQFGSQRLVLNNTSDSLLFENGIVWTGSPPRASPGWLLVAGKTVASFGTGKPPDAKRRVDLAGRALLPGFVDAHSHLSVSAWLPYVLDGSNWHTADDLRVAIERCAQMRSQGAWIVALGANLDRIGRLPKPEELDELGGGRPVLVSDFSLHRSIVSSSALRQVMSGANPTDIDRQFGRPTGMIWESAHAAAFGIAMSALALELDERGRGALLDQEAIRHLACGVTTCHDPCVSSDVAVDLEALRRRTPLRLSWSSVSRHSMLDPAPSHECCPSCGDGPQSAKLFMDGAHRCALCLEPSHVLVMAGRAAGQALRGNFEPVRELTRYRSVFRGGMVHMPYMRMDALALTDRIAQLGRNGVRPKVHAVGNHAVRCTCSALKDSGCRDATIEHLTFLTERDVDAVADTGAIASLQPGFIEAFGAGIVERGMVPRLRAYPTASLRRAGVPIALSSDNPCGPLDPLANIRSAVQRRTRDGCVVDIREALSIEEAVEAYTVGGYRAIHGRSGGGLTEGAPADFVILSGTILSMDAKVEETWVDGRQVFRV